MGATGNAAFNAKVHRNIGLEFATKQHKSLPKNFQSWASAHRGKLGQLMPLEKWMKN